MRSWEESRKTEKGKTERHRQTHRQALGNATNNIQKGSVLFVMIDSQPAAPSLGEVGGIVSSVASTIST